MPAGRPSRAVVAVALLLAACDDAADPGSVEVRELEVPSPEEQEAAAGFDQASALAEAGQDRRAETILRRVVEVAPKHAPARSLLADVLMRRRDYAGAAPHLKALTELTPGDETARRRLYESLYGQGDLEATERACREWTRAHRDSSDAWYALGTTLYAQEKFDGAVRALSQASSLRASRADVRSQLGLVLLAQGKVAEAEAAQRDAVQRDARYGEAWFRLGEVVSRSGPVRYGEAIDAMRKALAAEPAKLGYVHLYLYRLLRLAAADGDALRAEDAENEWRTVLRVAGREMLRGDGLGDAGVPSDAEAAKEEKAARAAVLANPEDAKARHAWARLLHRRGDLAEAVEEYGVAVAAAPEDGEMRANLGAALLAQGEEKRAEVELREAVRLVPADARSRRNLGWALVLQRRDAEAVAEFDAALACAPDDVLSKKARGLARMHAGELDEGLQEVAAAGWIGR